MACKKWYMGTNTKMYKTIAETNSFVSDLCQYTEDLSRDAFELFVIPSYTTLDQANRHRNPDLLKLGAQNMGWEEKGQYTGEISPLMLQEVGCDLVMVGHSERRHVFLETDEMERKKVRCALDHGLICLLCIGETEQEKNVGKADDILIQQLSEDLSEIKPEEAGRIWIAYEPVWAIGVNGKPVTCDYVEERVKVIRHKLSELFHDLGPDVPIFYGGSVNNNNAIDLAQCPGLNGLFIGRSAWNAVNFNQLIRMALAARSV
ncbi:MAG: triose-phosphate isomerase [Clostridia bacterium]|nr:triose-phosphate isomerase [Clostridia bacterium]